MSEPEKAVAKGTAAVDSDGTKASTGSVKKKLGTGKVDDSGKTNKQDTSNEESSKPETSHDAPKHASKPAAAKKVNPAIAAIKARQAQMKALEDAQRAAEEEERRLEELERQKEEEAARAEEEANRRLMEEEEAEKEALQKAGLYMSKEKRERLLKDREKIKLMTGTALPTKTDDDASKKVVYTKKKKHAKPLAEAMGDLAVSDTKGADSEEPSVPVSASWEDLMSDDEGELSSKPPQAKPSHVVDNSENLQVSEQKDKPTYTGPELRSPICCVLGHVDTGKTKLLDKIRQTNVQEGEAGGITQQIGATFFPIDTIKQKTADIETDIEFNIPGLLIIDTPGHESFSNLRTRGSSLCNIAVLVVDIMHGLEPQTIESINILKKGKIPFVVALNKIDRLYGWKTHANKPFEMSFNTQKKTVKDEFYSRLSATKLAFSEQGLNSELCFDNEDVRKYVSLVPISAITGEGIPDLLLLLIELTQKLMSKSLRYLSTLGCTILEVKVIEGLGTTIDVILSNGILCEGDRIVLAGANGPIVTQIRALLTPQPLREMRVKSEYVHHKKVKAALGVKISAPGLEHSVAGSRLLVLQHDDDLEKAQDDVQSDLNSLLESVDKSGRGVSVQASTLGSLEALLSFLNDMKIPVSTINIGPVHKRDVIRASVMLELAKEYALMLCFDVKVDKDAQEMADEMGVRIFKADIIYHLFDQFTDYMNKIREERRKAAGAQAVFPCILRIVPNCVFNKRDPIVVGVDVLDGILKIGTPLCVPAQENLVIGRVTSIELNHKPVEMVKKGSPSVAIRIETTDTPKMVGRHFTEKDDLVSYLTRSSIDALKESFRDDLSRDDWQLVVRLKSMFQIN